MGLTREQGKRYGFAAVSEDTEIISERVMSNDKLCKLLYYNVEEALLMENLTDEQKLKLITEEYISSRPKLKVDDEDNMRTHVLITFDHFNRGTNHIFQDYIVTLDIMCHIENWYVVDEFNQMIIRPHYIADEMLKMLDGKKLTGIGRAEYIGARSLILASNPDYVGLTLNFRLVNSIGE